MTGIDNSLDKRKRSVTSVKLEEKQQDYLRRIGLSKEAMHLYELLLQKGALSARMAAVCTGDFPSAEYRLFYVLEEHRLVRRLSGRPKRFQALPLSTGLASSLQDTQANLKRLVTKSLSSSDQSTTTSIIMGRQALYEAYVLHTEQAKREIYLYSIGIAYSDKLEAAQRLAIKRGVSIKHVLQQKSLSNQHIISKWLRAGVRLRHLKQPRGFHFYVIDGRKVCITFSDPADTDNRMSVVTDNPAAVQLFVSYFHSLWSNAKQIEN